MLVVFLLELLLYAWRTVVHALFWLWFGFTKSQQLPPVRNKLLLKTATQLADKIRRGEVRQAEHVERTKFASVKRAFRAKSSSRAK